jgi:hypothetical protein
MLKSQSQSQAVGLALDPINDSSLFQALSQSQSILGFLRWKKTSFFLFKNGRQLQFFGKGKMTSIFSKG